VLTEDCQECGLKRDWGRDCTTGGRGNASRRMAESTPLLDEKQWLDGRTLALEGEIEGLRAPTVGLETALGGKAGGQRRATCRRA
jgi:hypothetical protein